MKMLSNRRVRDLRKQRLISRGIFRQAGQIVVRMAFLVGEWDVAFSIRDLAAADIIAGRKAWIIGMCGELRKGILLNLQQIVGIWCFLLWNISPEADLGEQQDGHPIEILKM